MLSAQPKVKGFMELSISWWGGEGIKGLEYDFQNTRQRLKNIHLEFANGGGGGEKKKLGLEDDYF